MALKDIRDIARKYTPEQIEKCVTTQVTTGANICLSDRTSREIVNDLAKAEYIRRLTERGMSLADALRELALHMRRIRKEEGGDS